VVLHKGAELVRVYVIDPAAPFAELNVPLTE
jgi:hypothetical protein